MSSSSLSPVLLKVLKNPKERNENYFFSLLINEIDTSVCAIKPEYIPKPIKITELQPIHKLCLFFFSFYQENVKNTVGLGDALHEVQEIIFQP